MFEKNKALMIPRVPSPSKTPVPVKVEPAPLNVNEANVVVPTAKLAYPLFTKLPPTLVGTPVEPPVPEV